MAAITDPSPELAYLGEIISERLEEGVPPPEEEPHRTVLLALSSMGRMLDRSHEDVSDAERAFSTRDAAIRAAAELILAVTRDPVEIRLIREDLMADMNRLCSNAEEALENLDPRFQGSGMALWAMPHLASLSDVLLEDPGLSAEFSRAYVLEDVCNLLTILIGLAWRLRAWAAVEQV